MKRLLEHFRDTSKRERTTRLMGETFRVAFGQTMGALGALVGVRVLTEILSPAQYGELALATTLSFFF